MYFLLVQIAIMWNFYKDESYVELKTVMFYEYTLLDKYLLLKEEIT